MEKFIKAATPLLIAIILLGIAWSVWSGKSVSLGLFQGKEADSVDATRRNNGVTQLNSNNPYSVL